MTDSLAASIHSINRAQILCCCAARQGCAEVALQPFCTFSLLDSPNSVAGAAEQQEANM